MQSSDPRKRSGRGRALALTALTCVFSQPACGGREDTPAVSIQDSAGVSVIVNDPERPAWSREQAWRLAAQPAIQVGNIPGDAGHQLYGVGHSRRLADGRIVVANTGFGDVRIYDAEGGHVATLTLPTGAAQPMYVEPLPGDSVLTALADGTILVLPFGGGPARTARAPSDEGAATPRPVGVFRNGAVLMRADLPFDTVQPGLRRHPVRFLGYAGAEPATLGEFGMKPEIVGEGVLVFAPEAHVAASDSTLWYGDAERFEVREVASGGRTLRIVRLDLAPGPVTGADTLAFRHGAVEQLERTVGEDSALAVVDSYRYPATFPAYDQIVVDTPGNVWVRWYQWFDLGAEKRWSVFDPEGRYLGDVSTPPLLEIHQIGEDFVLGRMATSRGVEAVYVYELIKP